MGRAGDQRLFACPKGLLQRDRPLGLQHQQGAGAVDEAGLHQFPHIPAQHILRPQAGDLLIGVVDQDGIGLSVGDVDAIVYTVQNGEQLAVDLLLIPLEQRGAALPHIIDLARLIHGFSSVSRQPFGGSPSKITMDVLHFSTRKLSNRSSSAASENAEVGMMYAPCPKNRNRQPGSAARWLTSV